MTHSDTEIIIKVLVVGESGVGKSALIEQLIRKTFTEGSDIIPTTGVSTEFIYFNVNRKTIQMCIYDTAGQEKFRSPTKAYYRGAHGIILVYDITNTDSFAKVSEWMTNIQSNADRGIPIVLIGNKTDLEDIKVSYSQAVEYAQENHLQFFLTSAKNGQNIKGAFEFLANQIIKTVPDNKFQIINHVTQESHSIIDSQYHENKPKCCTIY